MNKYGPKASQEVRKAVQSYKKGSLRSGRNRDPVRSRKQAIAIGIATARRKGYKVPKEESNNEER